jgi:hypothetical protein
MSSCTLRRLLMAAALGVLTLPGPARADTDAFHRLKEHLDWGGFTEARALAPRWGLPYELEPGIPFTRVFQDAAPGHCEAYGNVYYESEGGSEGFFETTGKYKNPAQVRVFYPAAAGESSKGQLAPVSPEAGPAAVAECVSQTDGAAQATFAGAGTAPGRVDVASTESAARLDPATETWVQESTARFRDLRAGDGLRLSAFESWLKVETRPDSDPVISYRLSLDGVTAGGQPLLGADQTKGVTLSGNALVGPDVVQQFKTQVQAHHDTLEALAQYGLRLFEPTVTKDGRVFLIHSPVVDAELRPTARQGQVMEFVGYRFGSIRTRVTFTRLATDTTGGAEPAPSSISGSPPPPDGAPAPEAAAASQPAGATVTAPVTPPPAAAPAPSPAFGSFPTGDYIVGGAEALAGAETLAGAAPVPPRYAAQTTGVVVPLTGDGGGALADGFRSAVLVLLLGLAAAGSVVRFRMSTWPARGRS